MCNGNYGEKITTKNMFKKLDFILKVSLYTIYLSVERKDATCSVVYVTQIVSQNVPHKCLNLKSRKCLDIFILGLKPRGICSEGHGLYRRF